MLCRAANVYCRNGGVIVGAEAAAALQADAYNQRLAGKRKCSTDPLERISENTGKLRQLGISG